ncbi:MAG: hypothetical protein WCD81_07230 [Candidatus Bathyarchaeia archaeon]
MNSISTIGRQVKIARIAKVGGGTKIVIDDMLSVTIRFAAYICARAQRPKGDFTYD